MSHLYTGVRLLQSLALKPKASQQEKKKLFLKIKSFLFTGFRGQPRKHKLSINFTLLILSMHENKFWKWK